MSKHQNESLPSRNRPVHLPPVERHNQPRILLVTVCIQPRIQALASDEFHAAFREAIGDADAWTAGFYMIMPDHIHVFTSPAWHPTVPIQRWTSYLKERIGKRFPHPTWKWQPDCWDRQMRDADHYSDRWEYVRQNPIRAKLVDEPDRWTYQGIVNELRW